MSEKVSSFINTEIGKMRHLFYISSWNLIETEVQEVLEKHREAFGEALGKDGKVVSSYKAATNQTFQEMVNKDWPSSIKDRMKTDQDPFMVVIDRAYDEFSPSENRWAIIWFSEFRESPNDIAYMLNKLASVASNNEDVFQYIEKYFKSKKLEDAGELFEAKPGFMGFSIDLKAIGKKLLLSREST
jgi:hypothetical protein